LLTVDLLTPPMTSCQQESPGGLTLLGAHSVSFRLRLRCFKKMFLSQRGNGVSSRLDCALFARLFYSPRKAAFARITMARLMRLTIIFLIVIGSCSPLPTASADDQQVDLLLVLAADISRSVDDQKFKLQRDGYVNAIADPRVVRAMTAGARGRIALCFFEWASANEQKIIVDWMTIAGESDARDVARRIGEAPRAFMARTSISAAIDYGLDQLGRSPFQAPRRVINVSGDGTNNSGREVTRARDEAIAKGVTINGLAILSEVPLATNPLHTNPPGGLTAYYENNVIGGPGAFVVEAQSFEAFGQLLIGKLIKEIAEVPRRRL
jgi:hypothetical protein